MVNQARRINHDGVWCLMYEAWSSLTFHHAWSRLTLHATSINHDESSNLIKHDTSTVNNIDIKHEQVRCQPRSSMISKKESKVLVICPLLSGSGMGENGIAVSGNFQYGITRKGRCCGNIYSCGTRFFSIFGDGFRWILAAKAVIIIYM